MTLLLTITAALNACALGSRADAAWRFAPWHTGQFQPGSPDGHPGTEFLKGSPGFRPAGLLLFGRPQPLRATHHRIGAPMPMAVRARSGQPGSTALPKVS